MVYESVLTSRFIPTVLFIRRRWFSCPAPWFRLSVCAGFHFRCYYLVYEEWAVSMLKRPLICVKWHHLFCQKLAVHYLYPILSFAKQPLMRCRMMVNRASDDAEIVFSCGLVVISNTIDQCRNSIFAACLSPFPSASNTPSVPLINKVCRGHMLQSTNGKSTNKKVVHYWYKSFINVKKKILMLFGYVLIYL